MTIPLHRALVALPLLAAVSLCTAQDSAVDSTRATLAKWVETQRLLAKERKDWEEGKETLKARIALVQGEIDALAEKRKDLDSTSSEASQKMAELNRKRDETGIAADELRRSAESLERRLKTTWPSLPSPLQEKLRPLYDRIPADPATTTVAIAERFQNVVGMLNEVNKFNSEITRTKELRTLSDGKPSEVETVYVGLGQAYFLSAKGEAGTGYPTKTGWKWERADRNASQIAEVFDILAGKSKPSFVSLPVRIQ
jgi:Skp family chaperone for outer membrane proteins